MEACGNLLGSEPLVEEIGSNVLVKAEPSTLDRGSISFCGQESDEAPQDDSQITDSNLPGSSRYSTSSLQNKTLSLEYSIQSNAVLGKDFDDSGANCSKIDGESVINTTGIAGTTHKRKEGGKENSLISTTQEGEKTKILTKELQGVPQGPLIGTATTSPFSVGPMTKQSVNSLEKTLEIVRMRKNGMSKVDNQSVVTVSCEDGEDDRTFKDYTIKSWGVPQGALLGTLTALCSGEKRTKHSTHSLDKTLDIVKMRKNGMSKVEEELSGINVSHDDKKVGTIENVITESQGVLHLHGALLSTPTTSLCSDEIRTKHSANSLDKTLELVKKRKNAMSSGAHPSLVSANDKDRKEEVKTEDDGTAKQGIPQGAVLGTATTAVLSGDLMANHSTNSLENTIEIMKKRKIEINKTEGGSSKKTPRKRKPSQPSKSLEYCNEADRGVCEDNLSPKASTSCETDLVIPAETDAYALASKPFSMFQQKHCLLNFRRYECIKCGNSFASKKAMKVHVRTHSEDKPFWCTECDLGFTENISYNAHMRSHRPYVCEECGADFTEDETLQNHKLLHAESKSVQCSLCPKMFKQRAGLASHMINAHPETRHSERKPFWCTECNKGFTQNHSYKAHLRIHSGERPYLCGECGAAFADNKTLQNHKALHSDEKTFKCTLCPKMFRQRAGLACHMKTHTDEKPFGCEQCGQSFKTKSTLKNHQRIHSEEKPYQCLLCPQAFKQRAGLACHSKVHDKGNPSPDPGRFYSMPLPQTLSPSPQTLSLPKKDAIPHADSLTLNPRQYHAVPFPEMLSLPTEGAIPRTDSLSPNKNSPGHLSETTNETVTSV